MKIITTLLIIISLYSYSIFAQQEFWQSSGLSGIRVNAVEADLLGNVYAGTTGYGLFVSTTGGGTWNEVNTGSIGDVKAIKVNSAGEIFASYDDVIRYSTNNGITWQLTSSIGNGINHIESGTAGLIFAGHPGGIEKSTNYGSGWEHISFGGGVSCLTYDLTGRLYVGTYSSPNSALFRSTDNGTSWYQFPSIPSNVGIIRAITFFNDYIFVATQLTGIYRSTDDGISWTQTNNGLTNLAVTECIIDENGILYAANYDGAFKSTDYGDSWIDISGGLPSPPATTYTIDTEGYLHAGFSQLVGAYRSINSSFPSLTLNAPNGGENWQVGSIQEIIWESNNVTNIQIGYTPDYGTNWIIIIPSTPSDGSYSWTVPNTPSTQCIVGIKDVNDSLIYDISDNLFTISTPVTPIITVTFPNGGEDWIIGSAENITWVSSNVNDVKLEYTTDNGGSWVQIISSISASSGTYNWTIPNTPSTQCKVKITDTSNPSIYDESDGAFAISPISEITVTQPNGGELWQIGATEDITWTSNNVIDVKIELSVNNGASWTEIVSSTPSTGIYSWDVPNNNSLQCLIKISDVTNQSVNDLSDSVFTIEQTTSLDDWNISGSEIEFSLDQNFPNPFNPSTTIQYKIPERIFVTLIIYDALGNEVITVVNEEKSAGTYKVEFDASRIPTGIYFYRLQAGSFIETKKMVLMK